MVELLIFFLVFVVVFFGCHSTHLFYAWVRLTYRSNSNIISFVRKLDTDLLRGGISVGQITELCGTPGIGKTQMAMQLAVNVTIPRLHAGQEGECIYIDTEGSLSASRLNDMAAAMHTHLCKISRGHKLKPGERKNLSEEAQKEKLQRQMREKLRSAQALTAEAILDKIAVFPRVKEYEQLIEVLEALPHYIQSTRPGTKLVIIDSVSMPLRVHSGARDKNDRQDNKERKALTCSRGPHSSGQVQEPRGTWNTRCDHQSHDYNASRQR